MAKAEPILTIYSDRGKRELPLNGVYRQLTHPTFYLQASGKIARNAEAMTPGITEETADSMSLEKINKIIGLIRLEAWRWIPVRRIQIPKKNGKNRPLGLPAWPDKLVQEVLRMLLAAYYGHPGVCVLEGLGVKLPWSTHLLE